MEMNGANGIECGVKIICEKVSLTTVSCQTILLGANQLPDGVNKVKSLLKIPRHHFLLASTMSCHNNF